MGNFLIVMAAEECRRQAEGLFQKGLRLCQRLKGQSRTVNILTRPSLWVAGFARLNSSGGKIAVDSETGNWLVSIGTWIHADGFGPEGQQRLLRLVREKGLRQVARNLEGFFVIAGGDGSDNEAYVLTDIVGSCHAYSRIEKGITAVAGSSLLLAALEESEIDPVGCQEFVQGGIIYEDRTLFREVRKLHPATQFSYKSGRLVRQECYWSTADLNPGSLTGSAATDALCDTIQTAARKIGSLVPRLLCDLTGGYDSRTLVAGFLSARVSISTAVSGETESPDVRISSALARLAAIPHRQSDPPPVHRYDQIHQALQLTDGEYDIVEYSPVSEIHREYAREFDLSVNGSFGEIARGYYWEILVPRTGNIGAIDAEKVARLRYLPRGFDSTIFPADQRVDLVEHFTNIIRRNNAGLENTPNTFQLDNTYLKLRMHRWQGRIASSTNQIWPCLSPFMFRSILEVMLQTDHHLRRRSLMIRELLPKLHREFSEYPLEHGYPPLPVTPLTLFRFWPIVPLYGNKAVSRLLRLGKQGARSTGPVSTVARLQLWQDPQIQEIMRCDRMLSTTVFEEQALRKFLSRSRHLEFPYGGQWARVLTLECLLRSLKEANSLI